MRLFAGAHACLSVVAIGDVPGVAVIGGGVVSGAIGGDAGGGVVGGGIGGGGGVIGCRGVIGVGCVLSSLVVRSRSASSREGNAIYLPSQRHKNRKALICCNYTRCEMLNGII